MKLKRRQEKKLAEFGDDDEEEEETQDVEMELESSQRKGKGIMKFTIKVKSGDGV